MISSSTPGVPLELMEKNRAPGSPSEALSRKAKHYKYSNTNDLPLAIHHGDSDDSSPKSFHHASDTLVFKYF